MIANALANLFAAITIDGNHPRDPAIAKMFGMGQQTKSGIQVTPEKVLALPVILRGINIVSNSVAKLPWYVFLEKEEGKEWDRSHPSWRAVNRVANKNLTTGPLKKTLTSWAMGWGNGIAYIDRPNWPDGPVELYPLMPDKTKLVRYRGGGYDSDLESSGELRYVTEIGNEKRWFEPDQVIHIRGLGGSPYWGYDIFTLLNETFGGAMAAAEFGHRFFGQGANPAGFIEMPSGLDEEAEGTFLESLTKASQGLGKSHKFILLEEGAKFHQVTIDPEKSQLLETKTLDIRLLAMAIGIKVHKLVDGANSAFASLEQVNQEHKDDDIMPWVQAFREEFNEKLLTDEQKDKGTHCIDVDDELLEWVPFKERAEGCSKLYNDGLITKDEGRRKINFGPSRSEYAKKYRIPANILYEDEPRPGTAVQPMEEPDEKPKDDKEDKKSSKVTAITVAWLDNVRIRLTRQADAKAKQGAKHFIAWIDALNEKGPEEIQVSLSSMVTAMRKEFDHCVNTATNDNELFVLVTAAIATINDFELLAFVEAE